MARNYRATNAFSKKSENHSTAVAFWFAFYNFVASQAAPHNPRPWLLELLITSGAFSIPAIFAEYRWRLAEGD